MTELRCVNDERVRNFCEGLRDGAEVLPDPQGDGFLGRLLVRQRTARNTGHKGALLKINERKPSQLVVTDTVFAGTGDSKAFHS